MLFFEPGAGGGQVRRVHDGDGVGLDSIAAQQPAEQMGVDAAQGIHASLRAELMEHPGRGASAAQPGKAPPAGLLGKLGDQKIERVCAGQQRQQMHPPELRGAQAMPPPARGGAGKKIGDEIVGHQLAEEFEQAVGARGRKKSIHV